MTFILSIIKQVKCLFIKRDCGRILVGERYEKSRKILFRCGSCNRL